VSKRQFHLAWFLSRGYGPKAWRHDWGGTNGAQARWMMPDLFVDLAKSMERACFDYLIIEDSCNVPYTYQNSHDAYLRYAAATPKLDPATLVPYLAQATKHLGLVPTLSTSEYPPFLLARLVNSLDHLTEGRVGWNIVTGSNDGGAQNYGMDKHHPHDERYERADEMVDVVTKLWDAWEPDAVVLDRERAIFADGSKVHPINHEGKYYKVRGPLSAPRSPQGRPVLCQAGGSAVGQTFAAKWADTIIASQTSIAAMKQYRDQVRRNAVAQGRDPDGIKVLFLADPIIDVSMEQAQLRRRQDIAFASENVEFTLAMMSTLTGNDFSKYPVDEPLPVLTSNGHQSVMAGYAGKTPREVAMGQADRSGLDYTGTADHVAGMMQEVMEEVGGDGFLLTYGDFSRRYVAEVCDGLVPELQRRGLTRTGYPHPTFRANLMEF
jgi:FMN-dependent oxidoreductase (nitrilotriacetate monooxygenase family)